MLGDRADYLWKLELSIKDVTSGKTKYAYFFCNFKYILLVDSQQYFTLVKKSQVENSQITLMKKEQIKTKRQEHYLRTTIPLLLLEIGERVSL